MDNNLKHYCLLIRNDGSIKIENPITDMLLEFLEVAKVNVQGGAVVKNPPANAGDMGSSPDPGRSHMPRSN